MACVVNRRIVQKKEVLVGASTANVKPAVALARGLDARQHLDGFQHIDLTHQCGKPLDGGHGDFSLAQVCALGVGAR